MSSSSARVQATAVREYQIVTVSVAESASDTDRSVDALSPQVSRGGTSVPSGSSVRRPGPQGDAVVGGIDTW